MNLFKGLLVVLGLAVFVYTVIAIGNEGVNLFASTLPLFLELKWPGQFFIDFFTYLVLSGIWVAWRHEFSAGGIALGIGAAILGMIYLSIYLLVVISKAKGDMCEVFLGQSRAASIRRV